MSNAMSSKRKQPHDETSSDAFAHTPVKKLKLNNDETPSNASPHTPVKKLKLKLKLKSPPEGEPTVKKAEAANDASAHTPVEKVKPYDETPSEASAHTPVKEFKLKLKSPRNGEATVKEVEAANDASPHSSVKKVQFILKLSPPKVTPTAGQKRKSPADDELADNASLLAAPPAKRLKPSPKEPAAVKKSASKRYNTPVKGKAMSTLVPRGERCTAKLGQPDDSMLRMTCDCSASKRVTELHFRGIAHSTIDWNNPAHISKINAWRNQIYGRAGLKARSVSMWHELEELWFELYFSLSIAESRKHGIMLPTTQTVRQAFNETFVGQVLQDKNGDDLELRAERQSNAFASKFNRVCPLLRAQLNNCVFGKSGDVFMPKITFEMMDKHKANGIETEAPTEEEDAAATLMSLANSLV